MLASVLGSQLGLGLGSESVLVWQLASDWGLVRPVPPLMIQPVIVCGVSQGCSSKSQFTKGTGVGDGVGVGLGVGVGVGVAVGVGVGVSIGVDVGVGVGVSIGVGVGVGVGA